jgi:hypothetical protein
MRVPDLAVAIDASWASGRMVDMLLAAGGKNVPALSSISPARRWLIFGSARPSGLS